MLERVESSIRARKYQRISANIQGESAEDVAALVMSERELAGIQGPTVSDVYSDDGRKWFNVQVVVGKGELLPAVDHFRGMGGSGITVNEASYVFRARCESYERLMSNLGPYFETDAPESGLR